MTLYCLEVRMSDLCHCSPANAVLIVKQATLAMFTGRGPVPMGPLALKVGSVTCKGCFGPTMHAFDPTMHTGQGWCEGSRRRQYSI